jgi:hypothetical protein
MDSSPQSNVLEEICRFADQHAECGDGAMVELVRAVDGTGTVSGSCTCGAELAPCSASVSVTLVLVGMSISCHN